MKSASELLGDHREGRGAVQYGGCKGMKTSGADNI